jgi:glycosyltransferase involved in cell wall biosynthesis
MKVLLVSPVFPYPLNSGLKIRTYGILKALARKHEVSLLCFYRKEEQLQQLEALRSVCRKVVTVPIKSCSRYQGPRPSRLGKLWRALSEKEPRMIRDWRSSEMEARLGELLAEGYDAVWIARIWLTAMFDDLPVKTVLDIDDLESEKLLRQLSTMPWKLMRALGYIEYWKLVRSQRQAAERHAAVVVTSDKDRMKFAKNNVFVLPNTVTIPESGTETHEKEKPDDVVFFGLMAYRPNVDAVRYFCDRIWPEIKAARPGARLWIVGPDPAPAVRNLHDGKSVLVTGYVENLHALLAACGVVVVPLRIGGGTRIKILEAMALGKPVVSTTVGCEGLDVVDGEHLLVADRPDLFAGRCLELMADSEKRRHLGRTGRRLVEEKYRWEVLPGIVGRIVESVAGN